MLFRSQLILNDLLTDAEKDFFQESGIEQCMKVKTNVVTQLLSKNPFPEVPTVLTPFLQTLPLQLTPLNQPAQGELPGIIPPPPPPNMQDVYIPAPLVAEPEPSVAIPDQEAATQQLPTQVIEPSTNQNSPPKSPNPNTTQSLKDQPMRVEIGRAHV